ncbi:hypothetical protein GTA08_BOTSDO12540 [Botryosphaeria dothidea]|uniref:Uncharacterized protein n=1 Tax=Botryosphaeria dothidea TaxID=55169 RepID=A0A8H4N7D3_9PEZI|nr:hypothetical protein GTA08_BOTSDO12540 [Botryosphaeria dothidea]
MHPANSAVRRLARLRLMVSPARRPMTAAQFRPTASAAFSTRPPLRARQRSDAKNDSEQTSSNPDYPPFSFEALGISKNMKMVIIGLLSVFGTIETWFWCKAIWRWWKGDGKDEAAE